MELEVSDLKNIKKILRNNSSFMGSCIEWTGKLADGYGRFIYKKKDWRSHRASYLVENGFLPVNLYICHTCNNKKCINIRHLYAGSPKDNSRDFIHSEDFEKTKLKKINNKIQRKEAVKNQQISFYSIKEFAEMTHVHPDTIRRAIKKGRLNGFKIGGGSRSSYRIPASELNRLGICDLEKIIETMVEKRIQNIPKLL